jgi:dipeptidyl aminopeptidase/acylaminoacyl peptidase
MKNLHRKWTKNYTEYPGQRQGNFSQHETVITPLIWPRKELDGMKAKVLASSLILVIGLTLVISVLQYQPGVTTINPARPPEDILEPAEMEKLRTLQNTTDVFLVGRVSPDDSTVIVADGSEQGSKHASWLDIQTGQMKPINTKFIEFFPQGEIAWTDEQTAVYLSNNANGDLVLVTLHREISELITQALEITGRPLSLSPDGSRLLIENSSNTEIELAVMDLENGITDKLLKYNGSTPLSIAWTADSSKLALVRLVFPDEMDQDKGTEIGTQDALGKLPMDKNLFYTGNVVDVFELETGNFHPEILSAGEHGDGYLFNKIVWSPDGERLLAKMIRPSQPMGRAYPVVLLGQFADRSNYRIYDAELQLIETLDRAEIEAPNANLAPTAANAMFVSRDEVLIIAAYGLNIHIFYFHLQTGEFHRLPTEPGTFDSGPGGYQVYMTHQSRQVLYTQSSFQHPSEIYRLDLEGGTPRALSQYNAPAIAANQIRVDEVRFELGEKITRVGYLLQPAGATFPPQNVPIVIHHQGGPGGEMTNRWGTTSEDPFNLLPNFGIGVLFMPFSGREGFGPKFYRALADGDNFGQIDVEESALAALYLLDHDYSAKGQVGISGCSYGGYVTNQSITQYPELFAAANSQCSIVDLAKWWEDNPYLVDFYQGALPPDRLDEYHRDSPIYSANQVKTPLLLFHGTDDFLPVKLVREFRKGVASNETPVELLIFKNEGHSLAVPASKLVAAQQQIAWFRKYLGIRQE